MLVNAATGSAKNIVPNRLIAMSNCSGAKRWTCASACTKEMLRSPSSWLSRRAWASIGADTSTPSALPDGAARAASRVV